MSVGPVNDFAPTEPMKEAGVWMIPDIGVPYVSVQGASTLDLVSGYSQVAPQSFSSKAFFHCGDLDQHRSSPAKDMH